MAVAAGVSGCVQPGPVPTVGTAQTAPVPPNAPIIDRLIAAARVAGAPPPVFDQLAAPGEAGPVPVLRVQFPDAVFFDTALDRPREDSRVILDAAAAELRDDRPDAYLTVVGHTDAVGGDGYNMGLSRRRAAQVAGLLVDAGVPPDRLTIAAVGRRQPLASDATDEGRARNRRVELLFSRSAAANLAVTGTADEVVQVVPLPPGRSVAPAPAEARIARPGPVRATRLQPGAAVQAPGPVPTYRPNPLDTYQPNQLGPVQPF